MTNRPYVSVILPVRNGMPFLREAIDSVLMQDFEDFELIVINDGSSDGTRSYLGGVSDQRLTIIDTHGTGLVAALNLGLRHCKGKYIARMDADDICMPNRLRTQVVVLDSDASIGVTCSDIERIDEEGRAIGSERDIIESSDDLREALTERRRMKPIVHPSVMIRSELIGSVGGYRNYQNAEDRDLWLRLVDICGFYRIPSVLLKYRITAGGISRIHRESQQGNSLLAVFNYLLKLETQVDLYTDHPNVWLDFQRLFFRYASTVDAGASAYETMKTNFRSGRYADAISAALPQVFVYPNHFLPRSRRKLNTSIMESALELARVFMASEKDLPQDFISKCLSTP